MRTHHFQSIFRTAVRAGSLLLFAAAAFGQQQINLAVSPTTTTTPDGVVTPMWGYFCGAAVSGSTATCGALNPASVSTTTGVASTWSPVVITVPAGAAGGLQINLTNNLSFTPTTPTTGATVNNIPTSIVIVGQVGGGLGSARTTTASPDHSLTQGCPTWFIATGAGQSGANTPSTPGAPCTQLDAAANNVPPVQGPRVQSMATEVLPAGATPPTGEVGTPCISTATSPCLLTWTNLRPGTYLLESGTHPSIQIPMGLVGVLVVTTPASATSAGTAYPGATGLAVQYNAELPLIFSEIDPVQNKAVSVAVNTNLFSETRVWSGMVGQCGNPNAAPGVLNTCYPPAVNYTPFYYLINGLGFNKNNPATSLFAAYAGIPGGTMTTTGLSGTVLVRMVNAGLRMHVPSIVGSQTTGFDGTGNPGVTVNGFTLIAEDGNALPSVQQGVGCTAAPCGPRVQTDVFMAAGKTYDVMVNMPPVPGGAALPPSLPVYDRELSLSGNASNRDAGMLAYIGVNGAVLPTVTSGIFAGAKANPDIYNAMVAGQPFSVTDTSKGVTANDVNVYGVTLLAVPTSGTLSCPAINGYQGIPNSNMICANGTFTYTPNNLAATTVTPDSFTYCANGSVTGGVCSSGITTSVTLGASTICPSGSCPPTAITQTFTSKMSSFIRIPSPGLLAGNSDPNNLTLNVVVPPPATPPAITLSGGATSTGTPTVVIDANGGFVLSVPGNATAGAASFPYTVTDSQGRTATGTVNVNFPAGSGLQVKVLDAQAYNNCQGASGCIAGLTAIGDYRWIIEEDKTFWVDPNCTTNTSILTAGCPTVVPGPTGQTTIPTFGTNFHASHMEFVAQGCTGPLSCEGGQTVLDNSPACTAPGVPAGCSATAGTHIAAVCDVGNGKCRPDPTGGSGFTPVNPSSVQLDPARRYYISVLPGDAGNPFPATLTPPACTSSPYTTGSSPSPALNPTNLNVNCGHTMSGAQVPPACNFLGGPNGCPTSGTPPAFAPVTVLVLPTPLPPGKLSVEVFEDDFPLNGEHDSGGGIDVISPIEPGLGGFNLVLWDTYGGLGDVTGQNSFDMFNQYLSNSLSGTKDPVTGLDACPISANALTVTTGSPAQQKNGGQIFGTAVQGTGTNGTPPPSGGITGMIVTCPKYESDNMTLSPLAGQAIVANLMPEKFSVQAYPAADRIARGEEWIQTNTLDGQHPHDSFIRIGEPSYFQEYGPGGYHVSIGFANPAIINARHNDVCAGAYGAIPGPGSGSGTSNVCSNTITGQVNVERLSRTPDQRLYPSGNHDALAWTQCWVSLGDPDAEDFMFTKCDANGNFSFTGVPNGNWRLTIGDQWNDQIIDGLSTPANVGNCTTTGTTTTCAGGQTLNMGQIGVQQWQSNLYTRTFIDDNKNGIWDPTEIGIPQVYTMIHYRDGHNANVLLTDPNGIAYFNETFPLFNWYVVEADSTRYKRTGTHTVYDAGGPADGSTYCGPGNGARACGSSTAYNFLSNTYETIPLPSDLSVPGAVYCAKADCGTESVSFAAGTAKPSTGAAATSSTGRIDPPWVTAEGFSGLTSHADWIDFGMAPYASCPPACVTTTTGTTTTTTTWGENGGIHGGVIYASTRPFDDASQMIQQPWEPWVPRVTINLYQEGFAADGVTPTLTMVDTTQTTSWDDWAQGFYPNSSAGGSGTAGGQKPYMSCPGQGTAVAGSPNQDLFFFSLYDQPQYLDMYNSEHNGGTLHTIPYNSQFKCYDAMHIGNQLQPAPFDGQYYFPSSLGINPTTGKPLTTSGLTNGVTSNMPGTNCTICVANPDTTDPYRVGTPMLPPGKYVVEVIMPPGYEVYKEEDKNLLIGDNFIASAPQQFAGLGTDIFILPDQASVASLYDPSAAGFNPTNYQNKTTGLGLNDELSGVPGFPGFQDPLWPCVGEMRTVPDYLSLFPFVKEVAPFAGAIRPLCDRKEVTLVNQMGVDNNFFIYTSTHIAAKFTGVITDDFTSEFDPFAPQFGEKFAPPNMPISTRDYLGNEISRVYSDHWGAYESMIYSSWEVNPPNITGYSPSMLVQCMNDPGPIVDTNPSSPTYGQLINDALFNPAYSNFCYEEPYMPGLTTYLDTPVVPTQAFVGAGYNNVDCALPDATPAIKEVDGDQVGPYVAASGNTLTITALGDQQVQNDAYSGPSANTAPYNLKTVNRHYGFGSPCGILGGAAPSAGTPACTTTSGVTIGGVAVSSITSWTDAQIVVTVPPTTATNPKGVQPCLIQQQAQYAPGASTAYCGQLVITAGNGKQSVDAVTVTIGGKAPTHVPASGTIQAAIDQAAPGDLIIVDPTCPAACTTDKVTTTTVGTVTTTITSNTPAAHNEMVIMWKPVRLQGVGAASTVINGNTSPAGKQLDPWRRHINCLFGLTMQGQPYGQPGGGGAPFDPNGQYSCPDYDSVNGTATKWAFFTGVGESFDTTTTPPTLTTFSSPQVDRNPSEALLGWDASLNGNLAELLQEPSLLGAYEGAGITVVGRGVNLNGADGFAQTLEGEYPAGSTLLTGVVSNPGGAPGTPGGLLLGDNNPLCGPGGTNPFPSNYMCNPSTIDGLSVVNSSQGGGGIFLHGWAHNIQIANNRIYNNVGTLSGAISAGQGEFGPAYLSSGTPGVANAANLPPGSCSDGTGLVNNQHEPWCLQTHVSIHNNVITSNSAIGDELFTSTLSGGGGVSFCTGNDYYKFNYNFVCGNLSAGEGGGVVHLGEIFNGDIEHNSIVLNQSTNPTIPTNGGGIMVQGTPDTDPVCPGVPDTDCPSGLSDGTGPGLLINANLIQGNSADSGAGGGIRLQQVNGTEVATFASQPQYWHDVTITNNIIVNNVAGWDGAGISLQDALKVNIVNNTIAHNDTLATSGVLTQSIGTPQASAPAGNCTMPGAGGVRDTASCPQPAGVSSTTNSSLLLTAIGGQALTCPNGPNGTPSSGCGSFSNPLLANDLIWQNRAFHVGVGTRGQGNQNQQNIISLYNAFNFSAAPTQTATGQCSTGVSYWDLGVRGDLANTPGGGTGGSGFILSPVYSQLNASYATGTGNIYNADAAVVTPYCNGSRVPPECTVGDGCAGPGGFGVPPGIADATAPNPVFSLAPSATVDEGNNWINVSWGPLTLSNPTMLGSDGNYGGGAPLGNYSPTSLSPGLGRVPVSTFANLPALVQLAIKSDFFGNARPEATGDTTSDIGAVEFQGTGAATMTLTPSTLPFGNQLVRTSTTLTATLTNSGATATTITYSSLTGSGFTRNGGGTNCGANLPPATSCTVSITFTPTQSTTPYSATLTLTFGSALASPPSLTLGLSGSGFQLTAPTSLTFLPQEKGTTSPAQTVTVNNQGTSPLTITAIALGGANPGQFTTPNFSNCSATLPFTLVAGASCTVTEQYSPTTGGPNTAAASMNFTVTGGGNPYSVALSGTSSAPAFTLLPAALAFGNQPDRTTSTTQLTTTVQNTGIGTLSITAITFSGAFLEFPQTTTTTSCGTAPVTLAAGGSCTFTFNFAPGLNGSSATAGSKTATLTVTATGAGSHAVALSGTATVATVVFTPSGLTTGTPNRTQKNGTITVTNTASATTGAPFTLTGAPTLAAANTSGTGTFLITAGGTCTSGTVLSPGGTGCTVNVQYTPPAAPGAFASTIVLNTPGTGVATSPVTYTVSGN